jgi:hypothetical protein
LPVHCAVASARLVAALMPMHIPVLDQRPACCHEL